MPQLPDELQRALVACRNLPTIPGVVLEILEVARSPKAGLPDVARLLSKDPALSARLLRVASSAAYAAQEPVTTVDRAVSRLGMNATLCVALSFSMAQNTSASTEGFEVSRYWRRSVITAVCARTIGSHVSSCPPTELFIAGLLQDIGMLAMHTAMGESYGALCKESGGSHARLHEIERAKFGADHSLVGAWMLERWRISDRLMRAVLFSHDAKTEADPHGLLRATRWAGALADVFCADKQTGADACQRVLAEGLKPDELNKVLARVADDLPVETRVLQQELPQEHASALQEQAKDALLELSLSVEARARDAEVRAHVDSLTGVFNRAYLAGQLETLFSQAQKEAQPLTLLFVDVDHFKKVNDQHGHLAGDAVLQGVAQTLHNALRGADVVARYGGEEFVLLLPRTGQQEGLRVAERVRKDLEQQKHQVQEQVFKVTASIGLATFEDGNFASADALMGAADQCVYAAKRAGRNRVQSHLEQDKLRRAALSRRPMFAK
ncbi:MAG: GGDEF domain-containing protein [Deltaproteobacteria bacterium]|nr:GGDEF domain-containing protein [Deltaproteobacteria bacterium]